MGFLDIFKRNKAGAEDAKTGGMEDFMTLIRVYYQAVMASSLGITNLNALPDLRLFKQTLKVATVNNRLGLGEKNKCRKMLSDLYGLSDGFFKEIDSSIKKNCKSANDVRNYLFLFQGFSQDLMTLLSNTLKIKLRIPSMFKNTLRSIIAKEINDYATKPVWKDEAVRRGVMEIRRYRQSLGYSDEWVSEYAFNIIMLAKKEPRSRRGADDDDKK